MDKYIYFVYTSNDIDMLRRVADEYKKYYAKQSNHEFHMLSIIDKLYRKIKENENHVVSSTEVNDNLIGHHITIEGAERYASVSEESIKLRLSKQYEINKFSLNALPNVSHKVSIMEVSGKKLATILYEQTGITTEGINTSYSTHIIGIDGNKLNKVICIGVKNPFNDNECYKKLNEVFGKF